MKCFRISNVYARHGSISIRLMNNCLDGIQQKKMWSWKSSVLAERSGQQ